MNKIRSKRMILSLAWLGLLAALLVASYFLYVTLPPTPTPHAQLDALLNGEVKTPPPAEALLSSEGTPPKPDSVAGKPRADMAKTEFESKLTDAMATEKEPDKLEKDYLPPPRLAPDMFVFSSLPFNAPVAEFPLVLVGQKNLEWYRPPVGMTGGGMDGGGGDNSPSIYRNPPVKPPKPPPGPRPPPGPPPKPPPEVSNSGL